jgi:phenylacetate-CoA ligase
MFDKMYDTLKKSIFVKKIHYSTKPHFPKRIVYHKDYFLLKDLLCKRDNQVLDECYLRKQLAFILRESLLNVPYYREKIKIRPRSINSENVYDALKEFPFLDKKSIMDNKEAFINEKVDKSRLHYGTSGGSTGQGIGVWRTKREGHIEQAFFDYEWGKLGYQPGKSKVVRFATAARRKKDEIPWQRIANHLYISPYHLTKKWLPQIYQKILDFQPDFFHTYPSCLEGVARYMRDNQLPPIICKGLLLASEVFTEDQCHLFLKMFNAPMLPHYGLSECSNLAFGYYDKKKDRVIYKINDVYGVAENRKSDIGYEIIGTSYWNIAMPLIRYRTQDYGQIVNGVIERLDGRSNDFLVAKDGSKIPGFTIKIDEFTWDYVNIYQVVQNKKGCIELHIVPKRALAVNEKNMILEKQIDRWGGFFDIELVEKYVIPRTKVGKMRLIINNL